jgi:hypothetical protein
VQVSRTGLRSFVRRRFLEALSAGRTYQCDRSHPAVAEGGILFREIASVIGRRLNLPAVAKTREEADEHFGWFEQFAAGDLPASSEWTRKQLGWRPKKAGLLADVDQPYYFAVWRQWHDDCDGIDSAGAWHLELIFVNFSKISSGTARPALSCA